MGGTSEVLGLESGSEEDVVNLGEDSSQHLQFLVILFNIKYY
jgi:hypothetical protein